MEKEKATNLTIIILLGIVVIQTILLVFLWDPERFKKKWEELKAALQRKKDN